MNTFEPLIYAIGLVLLIIVALLEPWIWIYVINYFFNTGIPYTFGTWLHGMLFILLLKVKYVTKLK